MRAIASVVCDSAQLQRVVDGGSPSGGDEVLLWPIGDVGTRAVAALRRRPVGSPRVIEWASLPGTHPCIVTFGVRARRLRSDTVVSLRCDAASSMVSLESTLERLKAHVEGGASRVVRGS